MVYVVLALALAQGPDTTYKDEQTARLISRARVRHAIQDTLVHDYLATVRTRIDAGFGRSRFARIRPIVAMETAAEVTWARPNDLRVKIVGVRAASALRGARVEGTFSNPWFVPRGLGDSIRFVDRELPNTPALHPLAESGPEYYRYAIFDSLSIELPGRRVSAVGVRIEPRRMAPALIAGNVWLDAETAEVVRMTFTYLGDYLWSTPEEETAADSAEAKKNNARANKIVQIDAELEYALHEGRYWMPYRQLVTLMVEIPLFISAAIPVHFITTFGEYRINQGVVPRFSVNPMASDSGPGARCRRRSSDTTCVRSRDRDRRSGAGYTRAEWWSGGRWELEMPPADSLSGYEWPDKLALQPDAATEQLIRETAATLANIENDLPAEWVGRRFAGVAFETFSDLIRFNRVQGLSLGVGFQRATGGFSSILASARYGISDHRATGRLTFRREAPGGRLDVGGWRDVQESEPWTHGSSFGNTVNAAFAGHDDADYYLATGGGLTFTGNTGWARDARLEIHFERARSMPVRTHSAISDFLGGSGQFPANPPVLEGDFVAASVSRRSLAGPLEFRYGLEGITGVGGTAGSTGGRGWSSARIRFDLAGRGGALVVRGGTGFGDPIPQLLFRAGGPETVRGYDYGSRVGRSTWSAQLDVSVGKGNVLTPVLFADAGNTTGGGEALTSVGGGLSLLGGLVRFNLAKGLTPRAGLRFDLLFRTAR